MTGIKSMNDRGNFPYNKSMPRLITLKCPDCGAKNAVSEGDARYTCMYCGKEQKLQAPSIDTISETVRPLRELPQPADVSVEGDGETIRIERRWYSSGTVGLVIFCVLWDGFLGFWYWNALRTHADAEMFLGPILHVAIGIVLTYFALTGFLNRTVVTVTRDRLSVRHGPLPWWGNRTLSTREIRQLFTKKGNVEKNGASTYNLFCTTLDGKSTKLLSGLVSSETALFIEQQIESWLNLPDHPVKGEIHH